MRWARHIKGMKEVIILYKILAGKTDGNKPLGRYKPICEGNINKWVLN
jgi:hypothetical protein